MSEMRIINDEELEKVTGCAGVADTMDGDDEDGDDSPKIEYPVPRYPPKTIY
jgi:hypothetical protein